MDVSSPQLRRFAWSAALVAILLIALVLRLHGIHDPLLDHPGWRQGDTAAIARNFARLRFNIMYPQTMYDGPPPNYVELELQIVPFLAAALYKMFGVHPVFGRFITLGFSLGTVAILAFFGRWLFSSTLAGLSAAFLYAVFPGSVYYGRTFMPDCAMVFFLTAALFATARYLAEDERLSLRSVTLPTLLLALAYLAKPVAAIALFPVAAMIWQRMRARRPLRWLAIASLLLIPLLLLTLYDRRVASYAEWHWASGITRLHVLPALRIAFLSGAGFGAKVTNSRIALGMLRETMVGGIAFALAIVSFIALGWTPAKSRALLWGWLAGGLVYIFVVVSVERVDYYLLALLPLFALVLGGGVARFVRSIRTAEVAPASRYALLAVVPVAALAVLLTGRAPVAAYYRYNKDAYLDAVALDRRLPQNAIVVIGHYGPDVQYYVNRFGWEEDPLLWTPFDEESAIRKGARYFISIEDNRLRNNLELCAWLQRFPLREPKALWPVYVTDPSTITPQAELFWRRFRIAERARSGRAFLTAHRRCVASRGR